MLGIKASAPTPGFWLEFFRPGGGTLSLVPVTMTNSQEKSNLPVNYAQNRPQESTVGSFHKHSAFFVSLVMSSEVIKDLRGTAFKKAHQRGKLHFQSLCISNNP